MYIQSLSLEVWANQLLHLQMQIYVKSWEGMGRFGDIDPTQRSFTHHWPFPVLRGDSQIH